MTREEAIRQIENRWSIMDYGESEALGEALDMAIESLQAECEDYEHATLVDIKEPLKVSVVRCKDCVWSKEWNDNQIFCDRILMRLRETDFCSYGERREPTE